MSLLSFSLIYQKIVYRIFLAVTSSLLPIYRRWWWAKVPVAVTSNSNLTNEAISPLWASSTESFQQINLQCRIDRRTWPDVNQFHQRNSPGDGRVLAILQLLEYCKIWMEDERHIRQIQQQEKSWTQQHYYTSPCTQLVIRCFSNHRKPKTWSMCCVTIPRPVMTRCEHRSLC